VAVRSCPFAGGHLVWLVQEGAETFHGFGSWHIARGAWHCGLNWIVQLRMQNGLNSRMVLMNRLDND
jgi:hypothetical protein